MSYVVNPPDTICVPVVGGADLFPVRRVYCVGRNYAAHAREMGFDPDREPPFFFCKPADAVAPVPYASTLELTYPPQTNNYHYEIELVAAIGHSGCDIPSDASLDYVWGYAVGLDMTRRDLQMGMREKGRPWEIGKAFDVSAPIGPIHAAASVNGLESSSITLDVDGERKQDSRIDHLIWSVSETISHLSRYFKLEPGDLIYTGTPEGVGPVEVGQTLVGAIEALGRIEVKVV